MLGIIFFIIVAFSFHSGNLNFTTTITTTTRYLVVLETYNNSFSIHLLKFQLENEEKEITYVHQLFSPKNLQATENIYDTSHWALRLVAATEEETEIYTLKCTSGRIKYTIKDREFLFSFDIKEDTEEENLMEQQQDQDLDGATVSSTYKIEGELYSPILGIKLDEIPPTVAMSFFVESNFEPLPKKFVKEIVVSFTISLDEETFAMLKR